MTVSRDDSADGPRSALGRWARRKAEVAREHVTEEHVAEKGDHRHVDDIANGSPGDTTAGNDAEHGVDHDHTSHAGSGGELQTSPEETQLLSDADMPDVESLVEGSDFSQFMNPGVSDALRKRALSRLFRLPVFGIRDGLDDYDEDFRSFIPLGDTITADMRFEQQRLKERAQELLEKNEKEALVEDNDRMSDSGEEKAGEADSSEDRKTADKDVQDGNSRVSREDIDAADDDDVGEAEDDLV